MTAATLAQVLQPALAGGYAVAGLVCLGWEDMRAYVAAAEAECLPVILQAGPACRAHMPLRVLGMMLRELAEAASVPVVIHLDHGISADECRTAIDAGFTSVMYDGSRLSLAENIAATRAIVNFAHAAGLSCEGEIGFVGYAAGEVSRGTNPHEAGIFARETGVDAMAISIGNTHLQQSSETRLDLAHLRAIEAEAGVPLVIHGGSGVEPMQRAELARTTNVCKFNIGTELRTVFGRALRQALLDEPETFDRVAILKRVEAPLADAARIVLRNLARASA